MRLAVHGPQERDRPVCDNLPLSIDEVVAATHHSPHIVQETWGLGEDLVLQEEQSGRSEGKEIPRQGKQLQLFCLRLRDILLLLSLTDACGAETLARAEERTLFGTRSEQLCVSCGGQ